MMLAIQARIQKLRTEEDKAHRRINVARRQNDFSAKVQAEKTDHWKLKTDHLSFLKN